MRLEQFKTQVLLLHSEQSALDTLSSGFSDRYTVHCATSGSEALNFLGDTPIHIIISAQNLPGMSGAEALREAKKRSPDTIGILLTGSSNEAVVGDKEVFQVVRGDVGPGDLVQMIEGATQQMRLMALAESANDTAANVDEPSAEHIVMETDENGSTIISDGTGQMPALDPDKVSAAASVGARSVDILVLTKDEEFLSTVRDSARGLHNIVYANTLGQADEAVAGGKIGVLVVDAGMVGSNVEKLTLHLRKTAPRLVSIVAGRRDDGEMLMDLINRGKVYRFLLKPVSPGRARLAIEASIKHHLEAPDAAFKISGAAAPAKKPKPAAQQKPAAKPKVAAIPEAPAPKPQAESAPRPETRIEPRIEPQIEASSPVADGLADAFGDDDSSFTQTMTGIATSVGKSISGIKQSLGGSEAGETEAGAGGSSGSPFTNPKIIGGGIAAVAVIAAGIFWAMSGSEETTVVEQAPVAETSIIEADPVFEAPLPERTTGSVEDMLDEARLARDAGQVFNPPGSNAIELYAAAAAAEPDNAEIAAEFNAIIGEALSMAETALLEANVDDATAALDRVAIADPDNSRLPFLTAQLTQMQLRAYLDDARAAIRDTRFQDAAIAIDAARSLDIADASAIDAVAAELTSARSAQQNDEVLALANARLEEGALLDPSNDNARYYFELALANDPESTVARQGLTVVAGKLVLSARNEIDAGRLDSAEAILADARQVDPTSAEVIATLGALQDARDRIAANLARAEAERRAAAEQARLERERAEQAAAAKAEQEAIERAQAESVVEEPAEAAVVEEPTEAVIEEPATDAPAVQAESRPVAEAVSAPVVNNSPVAVSSLKRTRYVAPKYPRSAERRSQSGWVDLVFTVNVDGSVKNIEVRDSEPGDLFVNAAVKAVEKWEFEPVVANGVVIEKRAGVRMMFAIE